MYLRTTPIWLCERQRKKKLSGMNHISALSIKAGRLLEDREWRLRVQSGNETKTFYLLKNSRLFIAKLNCKLGQINGRQFKFATVFHISMEDNKKIITKYSQLMH